MPPSVNQPDGREPGGHSRDPYRLVLWRLQIYGMFSGRRVHDFTECRIHLLYKDNMIRIVQFGRFGEDPVRKGTIMLQYTVLFIDL